MVELMIVVAIIAVLAAIGTYGVQAYIRHSRTSEAYHMITSIKAGEEAYRDETFAYLDVSTTYDNRAPAAPGPGKRGFAYGVASSTLLQNFAAIGVQPSSPVVFSYSVVAGAPGAAPAAPHPDNDYNWVGQPAPGPWYVVLAVGDQDGDGTYSYFVGSSFTDEISRHDPRE